MWHSEVDVSPALEMLAIIAVMAREQYQRVQ